MTFGNFTPTIRRRVVVTGIGLVTPLGVGTRATWEALCSGKTGTCALRDVPEYIPNNVTQKIKCAKEHAKVEKGNLNEEENKFEHWDEQIFEAMPCQVAAAVREDSPFSFLNYIAHKEDNHTDVNKFIDDTYTKDNSSHQIYKNRLQLTNYFKSTARETRGGLFCKRAVWEALCDAGLINFAPEQTIEERSAIADHPHMVIHNLNRVGVNIGVGIPSIVDVTDVALHLFASPSQVNYHRVHPFFVPKILGNSVAGNEAIRYGFTGPIASSVAACATGAQCIGEAANWVRDGRADVVVCGAAEACITPTSIAGFARMRALCTKYNETPSSASRPFDVTRCGFVMGEGAGIFILEEYEHAKARLSQLNLLKREEDALLHLPKMYGELRGFGLACDAFDVAAPHPRGEGAERCVLDALRDSNNNKSQNTYKSCNTCGISNCSLSTTEGEMLEKNHIQYVNAHATGTIGDEIELHALIRSLREPEREIENNDKEIPVSNTNTALTNHSSSPLFVSSSKGALGHLLGAAGSVEAAIAILSLYHQRAPPTANLTKPCISEEDECKYDVHLLRHDSKATLLKECKAVLSTSFGFGGINTALLFSLL